MINRFGPPAIESPKPVRLIQSGVTVPFAGKTREVMAPVTAGAAAPVDGARVAALRAAIAGGGYHVDSARIAAHMIASDLGK